MKTYKSLSFAILTLCALAGCEKNEPDTTGQYVGQYIMTYKESFRYLSNGQTSDRTRPVTLTVAKGANAGTLQITEKTQFTVDLVGSRFTVRPYSSQETINGNSYTFSNTGTGTLSGSGMTLNRIATGTVSGQRVQITTTATGIK